MLTAGTRW